MNIERWFKCPVCGQKLLKYDEKKGSSRKLYLKCKKCKNEIEIKVKNDNKK